MNFFGRKKDKEKKRKSFEFNNLWSSVGVEDDDDLREAKISLNYTEVESNKKLEDPNQNTKVPNVNLFSSGDVNQIDHQIRKK